MFSFPLLSVLVVDFSPVLVLPSLEDALFEDDETDILDPDGNDNNAPAPSSPFPINSEFFSR